jgi:hypothetical protein
MPTFWALAVGVMGKKILPMNLKLLLLIFKDLRILTFMGAARSVIPGGPL